MTASLDHYQEKRDFSRTPEPEGGIGGPGDGLRFVVQRHLARNDHYDFRLEWGGVLLSWAVPKGPSYDTRDKRLAVRVEDHPLAYRHFEGIIPQGEYGGGTVLLWDEGYWEPQGDAAAGLGEGALKFTLQGRRLKGRWALIRLKAKAGEPRQNWLLLKEKDAYAQTGDGVSQFTASIRSGRTLAEIADGEDDKLARNPFESAGAQLAKLAGAIPNRGDWLYELKYDGYRILAFIEGNSVRLLTRNHHDYSQRFREAAASLLDWAGGRAMVLDGEMVVTDQKGKTDFQALQNYLKSPVGKKLSYIVFDLLALDGKDLRGCRLIDRKEMLEGLLKDAPPNLRYSRHVRNQGEASLAAACEAGLEGIVGKKADSVYSGERNGDWLKLKCAQRQEFVIGGYTLTAKKARDVSALLLGYFAGADLIYAGRAGSGLSAANAKALAEKFAGLIRPASPFKAAPPARPGEEITWLAPELVAEIRFSGWTLDQLIRQASFKGLRTDKSPQDVQREVLDDGRPLQAFPGEQEDTMETAGNDPVVLGIRITHPDKLLFAAPAVTKIDVVRYYEKMATAMLPYLSQRILSIVRCPKGIAEACFYKKHPGPGQTGIKTIAIPGGDGETEAYFYIEDAAGLIGEAQMGTLEFHTWGSRVETLEQPDLLVFDLDPDQGLELALVRQGVRDLQSILAELPLVSYLKTSGGKGYHVAVPLRPAVSWEAFYDFAKGVAQVMERKWPDRYTSNVRKARRANKIFIDWMRNGRGATSIAPYSIRARSGAKVSMPIAWEELDTVAPDGVDMAEALQRINGIDPWQDFFRIDQRLK